MLVRAPARWQRSALVMEITRILTAIYVMGCGQCVASCCATALYFEGYWATVEEVLMEVLKDVPFYKNSGGGITLSGGEALVQAGFAYAAAGVQQRTGFTYHG